MRGWYLYPWRGEAGSEGKLDESSKSELGMRHVHPEVSVRLSDDSTVKVAVVRLDAMQHTKMRDLRIRFNFFSIFASNSGACAESRPGVSNALSCTPARSTPQPSSACEERFRI